MSALRNRHRYQTRLSITPLWSIGHLFSPDELPAYCIDVRTSRNSTHKQGLVPFLTTIGALSFFTLYPWRFFPLRSSHGYSASSASVLRRSPRNHLESVRLHGRPASHPPNPEQRRRFLPFRLLAA